MTPSLYLTASTDVPVTIGCFVRWSGPAPGAYTGAAPPPAPAGAEPALHRGPNMAIARSAREPVIFERASLSVSEPL